MAVSFSLVAIFANGSHVYGGCGRVAINHGTRGGYNACYKRPEGACDACKAAAAEYQGALRREAEMKAQETFAEALELEPAIDGPLDALDDARDNLRIVRAAMRVSRSTRDVSALSKQRDELVARIKDLEAEQNKGGGVLGSLDAEFNAIIGAT